ncbi:unnamed protein product [Euphydryas editha]|uniref:Uncharacterized protein n=1 Tax=Euphydryas editha TaxID=104508 RepID=A0AAU9UVS6_EUPED|nr:unnamed protein product [Euphydryas editha]
MKETTTKPVWTYGIELWATRSNSNIEFFKRFEAKAIKFILNILKFIHNKYILHDQMLDTVNQESAGQYSNYQQKLTVHVNTLAATSRAPFTQD